jgi:protein-S-isoprenylcysteine O-methyltransferase Ste14
MASYAIFFGTFLYLIVFVGDFPIGTRTVDLGPEADPIAAVFIDIALIALFGLQHSVMARQGFKRWWTKIVPPPIERSIFVLAASAMLMILFIGWRPIDKVVWSVNPITHGWASDLIWMAFWIGWLTVLISTFLINHFELFGLHQVYARLRGRSLPSPTFKTPGFYRHVRHPIYLGLLLAFWATPTMTAGHLLFALATTGYILIGIYLEERDLISLFGDQYRRYREQVSMLIPLPGRKSAPPSASPSLEPKRP